MSSLALHNAATDAAPVALAFLGDPDSQDVVRRCLADAGILAARIERGGIANAIESLAHGPSPQLLFVDIEGVGEPATRLAELANVCDPSTAVIVIGDKNDIVLYRDLKSTGISEYFFKPLVQTLVARTVTQILTGETEAPIARRGKLVSVLGVRGGVGATTIAVNIAYEMAEKNLRLTTLVDLDFHFGDAAMQLDLTPTHALCEAMQHPERIDDLFLERAMLRSGEKLRVLSALEPLGEPMLPEQPGVIKLLGDLLSRSRYVVVDLPAVAALRIPAMLDQAGVILLVSDASLPATRDVLRWRERLGASVPERSILHVVNRYDAVGSLPQEELTRALGHAPDILIPFDPDLASAANWGVKTARRSRLLRHGLGTLFRHISGEAIPPAGSFLDRVLGR